MIVVLSIIANVSYAFGKHMNATSSEIENAEIAKTKQMLAKAVDYYKKNKDTAFAAFSRQGDFIDNDLYVYVVDVNGEMLASGGSSSALIGRDVSGIQDAEGKYFFREMIDASKTTNSGTVEYRWLNRKDGNVQRKITYYERVDDYIIAVGLFIPRANATEAMELLDKAVISVNANTKAAFEEFNNINGKYIKDDLYVFVVDEKTKKFVAHGIMPRLIGVNALELRDADNKEFMSKIIAAAISNNKNSINYRWYNRVTGKIEDKHTYVKMADKYIVGVGFYTR